MYFDIANKKARVAAMLKDMLGINPYLELTSIRMSAALDPSQGNSYQISLLDENRRSKATDKGVEKNHLFIGFDIAVFLAKEREKQSGAALPVPYPDGAIFNKKATAGTATSPYIPSEIESLLTLYNGTFSIEDQDSNNLLLPRPMFEFLYTPDTQYKASTNNTTEVLPSFDLNRAFRPIEPFVIISGNKDTAIKLNLGEGSKESISGSAGSQNVIIFNMLGFRARGAADSYMVKLASLQQQ